SAHTFDGLYQSMHQPLTFIDNYTWGILSKQIEASQPTAIAMSIPFPGNLYAGLRCGRLIKKHFPNIKIVMGGGYPNTELRSITDARIFEFVDYITLDDGEACLVNLLEHWEGKRPLELLKRTFATVNGKVEYFNASITA